MVGSLGTQQIEAPSGGEVEGGGASGEGVDGGATVGGGGGAVGVPVAVLAEEEVVCVAAAGDGLRGAVVADLGAEVFPGEGVGGMDVVVAQQAQFGGVGSAVEDGTVLVAVVAGHAVVSGSLFRTDHFQTLLEIEQTDADYSGQVVLINLAFLEDCDSERDET